MILPSRFSDVLFVDIEGEDNLLIDFEKNDDNPSDKDDATISLVIGVLKEMADHACGRDDDDEEHDMEPAIISWFLGEGTGEPSEEVVKA